MNPLTVSASESARTDITITEEAIVARTIVEQTIVERLSDIVAIRGDAVAVSTELGVLSYAELDRQSSRVARWLTDKTRYLGDEGSAGSDGCVGILLGSDASAVVAMVGALKAARPFIPLDPTLPPARLGQIIRLAGATVCVTDAGRLDLLAAARTAGQPLERAADGADGRPPAGTLLIERVVAGADPETETDTAAARTGAGPAGAPAPGDAAFVVFSSGSTGVPKGVVWRHQTIMNELSIAEDLLGIGPADQIGLALPTAFAAGITVLFWGLLTGATLHPFDPRVRGTEALAGWLAERGITTLHLTPALMRALVAATAPDRQFSDLRVVTSSGEAVFGPDVSALRRHLPAGSVFHNWSGSSETASIALYPVRPGDEVPAGPLPAGWPAPGKQITIVDEDGAAVPAGTAGTVVVTSAFLSGGYWNAPQPAAARFQVAAGAAVADPFTGGAAGEAEGEAEAGHGAGGPVVVYRSGDRGRLRPDGCLELLGRADRAVKIRGYLVEPAEVEAVLVALPEVVEAVVEVGRSDDRAPRLVAYVVCKNATRNPLVAVRAGLAAKLPPYMVPASIVPLPALPRNERGKIDRLALPPAPPRPPLRRPVGRDYWQQALCDLYARVLRVEEVGIDDDFLALGGDSLLAQQLLGEIATGLGVELPASSLVEAPTVAELAARAAAAAAAARSRRGAVPSHPTCVPLNPAGHRPPLFGVAGGGGLAMNFLSLARHLGPDQPMYGLQAHGLEKRAVPDWSIAAHARRHLPVVRLIQPRGPYYFVGHSLGGLIALEMAQMLRAAGEQVGLLALLDTTLPRSAGADSRPDELAVAGSDAGNDAGAGPGTALELRPDPVRSQRLPHLVTEILPRVKKIHKAFRLPLTGIVRYPGLAQYDVFFHQSRYLTASYRPESYDGPAVLYRPEDTPNADRAAWARHLAPDAAFVTLPGSHNTMLSEPNVALLAADLRARLAAT